MASGTKNKGVRAARDSVVATKPKPWGTIIAVVAVLALAGVVFGYSYSKISAKNDAEAAVAMWKPSEENKDPSDKIQGIVKKEYVAGKHVTATQRVAYDQSPPFGGPHDQAWADCEGVVYPTAVRNENMVHALEHGSVWITYNPDKVTGPDLDALKAKVEGQAFEMLSPYPGQDSPISLQSWGHQLKLDSMNDERFEHFLTALKRNIYQNPEPNSPCGSLAGEGLFDPANPPPFVADKPGPDAIPMDGTGAQDQAAQESSGMQTPAAPTAPATSAPAGSESQPPTSK